MLVAPSSTAPRAMARAGTRTCGRRAGMRVAKMGRCTMTADGQSGSRRRHADADLIRRSLRGDCLAARDLHGEYAPVATAFLRKLGIRRDEIDDSRQEVFLQFFRYLASFRAEAELKTWLFRLCVTEARRIRRRRRSGTALAALLRSQATHAEVPPASRSDATIQELVTRAVNLMPPDQRQAFILFEIAGLTGKDVAKIGGRSLPASLRRRYEAQRVVQQTLGIEKARPGQSSAQPGAEISHPAIVRGVPVPQLLEVDQHLAGGVGLRVALAVEDGLTRAGPLQKQRLGRRGLGPEGKRVPAFDNAAVPAPFTSIASVGAGGPVAATAALHEHDLVAGAHAPDRDVAVGVRPNVRAIDEDARAAAKGSPTWAITSPSRIRRSPGRRA
jgi:RNA polymerase sigma-70 factor, ECF subfamily